MHRKDIEFTTNDGVRLRGWLFTPSIPPSHPLPCLILSHGWTAVKEMDLDVFAKHFTEQLPLICLVFDNRGFGASDTGLGQPRSEIVPALQQNDIQDAITFASTLPEVDANKIGIWGTSYSGGHVLRVATVDPRVKAVLCQVPMINGYDLFNRLIRKDLQAGMFHGFSEDRKARMAGAPATMIPVADPDPMKPSSLPTVESWNFFEAWTQKQTAWKNEVTLKSIDLLRDNDPSAWIHRISPTPLLFTVVQDDTLTLTELALEAYSRAHEPKELHVLPGGHFDAYSGPLFEKNAGRQVEFLQKTLCA